MNTFQNELNAQLHMRFLCSKLSCHYLIAFLFGPNMWVRAACADRIHAQQMERRQRKRVPLAHLFTINLNIPYRCYRPKTERQKRKVQKFKDMKTHHSQARKTRKAQRRALRNRPSNNYEFRKTPTNKILQEEPDTIKQLR